MDPDAAVARFAVAGLIAARAVGHNAPNGNETPDVDKAHLDAS